MMVRPLILGIVLLINDALVISTADAAATETSMLTTASCDSIDHPDVTSSSSSPATTTTTTDPINNICGSEQERINTIENGSTFGVPQVLEHDTLDTETIVKHLQETSQYIQTKFPSDFYTRAARPWCYNHYDECTIWALLDDCEENPEYMKSYCAPACQVCQPHKKGPGSDFGVVQRMESDDDDEEDVDPRNVVATLEEMERYMNHVIWSDDFYAKVRPLCLNEDPLCTVWAAQGLCDEEEEDFNMKLQCAPACGTCEQLHYETRCPLDPINMPDVWQPGDLNRFFERIVADTMYDTTVWSRPEYAPGDSEETASYQLGPWIVTMENFIRPEEADRLKQWGHDLGYEPSWLMGDTDEETGETLDASIDEEDRTSLNTWCSEECENDPIVDVVYTRIQNMTRVPTDHYESFQLLKYEVGEFYTMHSDNPSDDHYTLVGPRILTVFLYLNDVEEGGETHFQHADITVKPKLGRAVVWPSVLNEAPNRYDPRTWHEAMPVKQGQKFGANVWIHLRSVTKTEERNCSQSG